MRPILLVCLPDSFCQSFHRLRSGEAAGCKGSVVIGQRLKLSGTRWTVTGADAITALCCREASSQCGTVPPGDALRANRLDLAALEREHQLVEAPGDIARERDRQVEVQPEACKSACLQPQPIWTSVAASACHSSPSQSGLICR